MDKDNIPMTMVEAQRQAIVAALRYTRGDMAGAAYHLGIGRATIYRKARDYEIQPEEWQELEKGRAVGC